MISSVYVARLKNARRIGHALKRLQREGCILIDDEGHIVTAPVRFKGFGREMGLSVGCVCYFTSNTEFDNGMHTPVAEFNERFDRWKVFHPSDAKSIAQEQPQ